MKKWIRQYCYLLMVVCMCSIFSFCAKDEVISDDPNAMLDFDKDTLKFDTVFVTMGSATEELKIYNRSDKRVQVSSISLGGGEESFFRLNIDGTPTTDARDVEIWADDSLYIFAEVTIDPGSAATPFVVEDSILFTINGNEQKVRLQAWGQNANFYGPDSPNGAVVCDAVWTRDLPYVITDSLVVSPDCSLTIEAGAQVYLHNQAALIVKGSLQVNGGVDSADVVRFQGTRLDSKFGTEFYQRIPGQWFGIVLSPGSKENFINGALIRNALFGVVVDTFANIGPPSEAATLIIQNSTIRDVGWGIVGSNNTILGLNTVVYNCAFNNLWLLRGGNYKFAHCTFVNTATRYIGHEQPILLTNNVDARAGIVYNMDTRFYNSVLYGLGAAVEEEIAQDTVVLEGANYDLKFNNCLIRTGIDRDNPAFNNCIFQDGFGVQDTLFADYFFNIDDFDLRLNPNSPIINKGLTREEFDALLNGVIPFEAVELDAEGKMRDEMPDIGAYEF
ncbi:MAG: hypothetical protein AB8B69_18655 [Chitinophagales bacterium]